MYSPHDNLEDVLLEQQFATFTINSIPKSPNALGRDLHTFSQEVQSPPPPTSDGERRSPLTSLPHNQTERYIAPSPNSAVIKDGRVQKCICAFVKDLDFAEDCWKNWKKTKSIHRLFDIARAFMWLGKALEQQKGHPQTAIKQTYEARALRILQHIAMPKSVHFNGEPCQLPAAQTLLGHCYLGGFLGLPVDQKRAYDLYSLAAKYRDPEANYAAANCALRGMGRSPSRKKYLQLLERAANLNHPKASHQYGMILAYGNYGVTPNASLGKFYVDRAVKNTGEKVPQMVHDLALFHENRMWDPDLKADDDMAFALYTKAAHLGHADSQYLVGKCFETGFLGRQKDPGKSLYWYAQAAEQHHSKAQYKLALSFFNGIPNISCVNHEKAFRWMLAAANNSLAQAEFGVGYFYQNGIGTKVNLSQACRWYMRAAHQGHIKARQRLERLQKLL